MSTESEYHKEWVKKNKRKHFYHTYKLDPEWILNRNLKCRQRRQELKGLILDALGRKCVRCGFDDIRALQVDHVNGDGCAERKKGGSHDQYLRVLKSIRNKENKYQILCANCNWIKRHENKEWDADNLNRRDKILADKIRKKAEQQPTLFPV